MLYAFKCSIWGIGATTPIFDPYASSYNHIFRQNTTKLHFLYSTKLGGLEHVYIFFKIPKPFVGDGITLFFGIGAPTTIFEPSAGS